MTPKGGESRAGKGRALWGKVGFLMNENSRRGRRLGGPAPYLEGGDWGTGGLGILHRERLERRERSGGRDGGRNGTEIRVSGFGKAGGWRQDQNGFWSGKGMGAKE